MQLCQSENSWESLPVCRNLWNTQLSYFNQSLPIPMAQPSTSIKKFDVFLSLRGDDTRRTLVDHLYHRLTAAKVHAFIDNEELEKGHNIGFSLEQAIDNSDYLIPIFRHQKGPFEQAFQEHRNKRRCSEDTIQEWKGSLQAACSASGYSLKGEFNGYEGRLVESLTSHILCKLQRKLTIAKHPVGIEKRADKVIELLQMQSKLSSVITLGIYGMAGIGKTTLAKAIFNSICSKFDSSGFVSDVKKTEKMQLQKKILKAMGVKSNLLMDCRPEECLLHKFLKATKALLILDDVDDRAVLDAVVGDWFLPGSRIIVTTLNKDVLDAESQNNRFYELQELDDAEALQFFSCHAFSTAVPHPEYKHFSRMAVMACKGIPLCIKILGELLCDKRSVKLWLEALKQLKSLEIKQIEERLKISIDELMDGSKEKEMFLDIACFFVGSEKRGCVSIWEASDWCPTSALNSLQARCLVKLTDGRLEKHPILRDLGRVTVKKESVNEPGERSRLWDEKEVRKVFKEKTVTKSVQGLLYDSEKQVSWRAEDFEPMRYLRLLSINNAIIDGDFSRFPSKELTWLRWTRCSTLQCLPLELNMKNIAVLDLANSGIKQVWDEELHRKTPKNLKFLNVENCKSLVGLPDFSNQQSSVFVKKTGCNKRAIVNGRIEDEEYRSGIEESKGTFGHSIYE
eukprot:Gb_07498 [translate_table: standard]